MNQEELKSLAKNISRWGVGCLEEVMIFGRKLRVVNARTHLNVYQFVNRRGVFIGEYEKTDSHWRYKVLMSILKESQDEKEKLLLSQIVTLRLLNIVEVTNTKGDSETWTMTK